MMACVVMALLAAGWAAKPVYRNWKKQRHLTQAAGYLNRGDLRNAALSARLALSLDPTTIEAARIMAEVTSRLRSPELVGWRQRIVDLDSENVTNRVSLAEGALMFGDISRAEQALAKIPQTNRNSVAFHQAAALILAGQNKLAEADAHFAQAMEIAPSNQTLRLNRAVIQLQLADTNAAAGALRTLEECRSNPALQQTALRLLTETHLRAKNFEDATSTARELVTGTNASAGDRALLLKVLLKSKSPEYAPELAALQSRSVTDGAEQVRALALWLISSGQADEASRWLSGLPKDLQSQQAVSMALADLHLSRADWPALEKTTKTSKWGEADFMRNALLARACREQQETMSASAAWLEAVRAAGNKPKKLGLIARQAGSWGWRREQEELLWTIVERHPGERWASAELAALVISSRNTIGLNRLSSLLISQLPENHPGYLGARNNFAATSLLMNQRSTRAAEMARDNFSRNPSNEAFASTYAYSLFLQGRREDALKAFAAVKPEVLENPSVAVYYGVILGTNSPVEAAKYLDLAAKGELFPEEKSLAEEMRKRL